VFGRREDAVLRELKKLLYPFGIKRFYTDYWGEYARQLTPEITIQGNGRPRRSNASISRSVRE
jgi:insertion element IS1 protein InsB